MLLCVIDYNSEFLAVKKEDGPLVDNIIRVAKTVLQNLGIQKKKKNRLRCKYKFHIRQV